ncbi:MULTISPECIES: rhodanese-like domain-containing protein [unclassified Mesorhizobium]|uniref:rhodanese-like domain-containing protein n=1 Tax=unclassified Mesorhizobium TaxID=325217 RepID=UPI001126189E|nr:MULTISPECIES: rhodanese-like domain-containing protein [unclassified Mesorhizobium]MBZ9700901.1 rhodanese-like domain-containing protein [Mesorhizobium sp. CO1-1-3]MBZ9946837.1 rhodanese-like domain-containing protein [Mesorhizobium sp. BR1-1-11]TPJ04788.1 rhodanese-like domain-containing protein [Mesorhizobium sp. B2-8-1]
MPNEARQICPTTTRRRVAEGALLLDVREQAEIDRLAFDVPNIIRIPLGELEKRYVELPRDRELVLACQSGGRSLKATYFLMFQGFDKVANMEGGMAKWASKGFPVKGEASSQQPGAHDAGGCGCGTSPSGEGSCCGSAAPGEPSCC